MRYQLRLRDDRDLLDRYAEIARQLVEQRRARDLSQQEVAELVGTTQSAIARIERGDRPPKIDTLLRIANALDCELELRLRPRTATTGGDSGSTT
jgi:transcriptional regulator with XRE-family HTH domain